MMNDLIPIVLRRIAQSHFGTFGMLMRGDEKLCVTCEEPWKDNARNVSCIPTGSYQCVPHHTTRFPAVWEVANVPGRAGILIHSGNTIKDTKGCILVGEHFLRNSDLSIYGVAKSRVTLGKLRATLPERFLLVVESHNGGIE